MGCGEFQFFVGEVAGVGSYCISVHFACIVSGGNGVPEAAPLPNCVSGIAVGSGSGEVLPVPNVSEFVREKFRFTPDSKQEEVLLCGAKRLLICCTRQWGKSTTAAALAAHRAMTTPGALVVCISPTLRQTKEFLLKARAFLLEADCVVGGGRMALQLANGSRLLGLPGKDAFVRGFSKPSLIIIDEAARVEDVLYKAVRPMLAAGRGDMALLSTPYGERGFFWREWASGGEEWTRIEVKATDCPRIPADFLESEKRVQGAEWFAQEYLCSFVGMENQAFRAEWFVAARLAGLSTKTLNFQWKVDG